jgi:hypothetical protein
MGLVLYIPTCNCIDKALCSKFIQSIFNEGLSYAHMNRFYAHPYETSRSNVKVFEGNSQLMPKSIQLYKMSTFNDCSRSLMQI